MGVRRYTWLLRAVTWSLDLVSGLAAWVVRLAMVSDATRSVQRLLAARANPDCRDKLRWP